jgi:hypothetical protein
MTQDRHISKLVFRAARHQGLLFDCLTDSSVYTPQRLPLLQEEALGLPQYEVARPPGALAAKSDTFFFTWSLLHCGQVTWAVSLELRTSSSNSSPQVAQANSNMGIMTPHRLSFLILPIAHLPPGWRGKSAGRAERLAVDPRPRSGVCRSGCIPRSSPGGWRAPGRVHAVL